MKKALEAKVEDVQYEMQVKSNCGTERDAFRKAVIALGRASGDSEAVATDDADLPVTRRDIVRMGAGGLLKEIPSRRSEEHTSELQSLMRISYAVFCLKKKKIRTVTQ